MLAEGALLPLAAAFLAIAAVYSSTGHGGGSGYLAVLLLSGVAAADAAPVALLLNIAVASIAALAFWNRGGNPTRLLLPLAAAGAPMAALGAWMALPRPPVALVAGPALVATAVALWLRPAPARRQVGWPALLAAGAGLGLLAGMTGIGGGIYLTPVLLMTGWATKAEAAWTSAAFIVINSAVGLAVRQAGGQALPAQAWWLLVPVAAGAVAGSAIGARRFSSITYRRVMAFLVGAAGLKVMVLA